MGLCSKARSILLAAGIVFSCGVTQASGLQVAPVSLTFLPNSSSAQGIWLTNTGQKPLPAQVRVFHWTQQGGEDVLTTTQDLAISPPMLNLAPGAKQLIRVIRVGAKASPSTREDAFRLLIDELPQPMANQQSGVQYVMRYSIPVFVSPAGSANVKLAAASLQWSLTFEAGKPVLGVQNTGTVHAQLSEATLNVPNKPPLVLSKGLLGYALPGMARQWQLPGSAVPLSGEVTLSVRINGAPSQQTIRTGS